MEKGQVIRDNAKAPRRGRAAKERKKNSINHEICEIHKMAAKELKDHKEPEAEGFEIRAIKVNGAKAFLTAKYANQAVLGTNNYMRQKEQDFYRTGSASVTLDPMASSRFAVQAEASQAKLGTKCVHQTREKVGSPLTGLEMFWGRNTRPFGPGYNISGLQPSDGVPGFQKRFQPILTKINSFQLLSTHFN